MLESSLTFRHDRGARLGMLPATCERPRGLSQSERSGLRARARKRKWSVRYMLCPRVRNRGPWCFPRTVWIPITCFLTSQVEGFAISSPFCFVQPFEKRSLVGSLYLEIGGLRPSSHQKIRRSRFRIMPACAYRSTTARVRLLLPKPSPRLLELEALESREPEKSGFPPARVLGFNFYLFPSPCFSCGGEFFSYVVVYIFPTSFLYFPTF